MTRYTAGFILVLLSGFVAAQGVARIELNYQPSGAEDLRNLTYIVRSLPPASLVKGVPKLPNECRLKIELLEIQSGITPGREITADLRLINSGPNPIEIPFSAAESSTDPKLTKELKQVALSLKLENSHGASLLGSSSLYGDRLITLYPGKWASVRLHTIATVRPDELGGDLDSISRTNLRVRGELRFENVATEWKGQHGIRTVTPLCADLFSESKTVKIINPVQ